MKDFYDIVSYDCSKLVTQRYSTSFSLGTRLLSNSIRVHIYNIYGFVRFADEIVDSFHEFNKVDLLNRFEEDLMHAISNKISLNLFSSLDFMLVGVKKKWNKTNEGWEDELLFQLLCA